MWQTDRLPEGLQAPLHPSLPLCHYLLQCGPVTLLGQRRNPSCESGRAEGLGFVNCVVLSLACGGTRGHTEHGGADPTTALEGSPHPRHRITRDWRLSQEAGPGRAHPRPASDLSPPRWGSWMAGSTPPSPLTLRPAHSVPVKSVGAGSVCTIRSRLLPGHPLAPWALAEAVSHPPRFRGPFLRQSLGLHRDPYHAGNPLKISFQMEVHCVRPDMYIPPVTSCRAPLVTLWGLAPKSPSPRNLPGFHPPHTHTPGSDRTNLSQGPHSSPFLVAVTLGKLRDFPVCLTRTGAPKRLGWERAQDGEQDRQSSGILVCPAVWPWGRQPVWEPAQSPGTQWLLN